MKRISVKGLADFMAANDAKRRTIVRQFKYPREDEAHAKIIYYREAKDVIEAYHGDSHDDAWLRGLGQQLDAIADNLMGRSRTRVRHNARAVYAYAANFSHRQFRTITGLRLRLDYSGVQISVVPDLFVEERGRKKIVKLEFGVDKPAEREIKVISQILFEAAQKGGLSIPASSVLYLDIARGTEHHGARMGSQLRRDIEAACHTISDIWDRV